MKRNAQGYTLIEAMVAMAILAIGTTIAVPAMRELLQHQRAIAATSALTTQLQLARMAAVTYRQPAVLCPSSSGSACDSSTDWSGGWILFMDPNGNRELDPGEDVVRVESARNSRTLRLPGSQGRPRVRYMPDGRSAGSNLTISVCSSDGSLLRAVIVNNAGRPRVARPTAPTSCPG